MTQASVNEFKILYANNMVKEAPFKCYKSILKLRIALTLTIAWILEAQEKPRVDLITKVRISSIFLYIFINSYEFNIFEKSLLTYD